MFLHFLHFLSNSPRFEDLSYSFLLCKLLGGWQICYKSYWQCLYCVVCTWFVLTVILSIAANVIFFANKHGGFVHFWWIVRCRHSSRECYPSSKARLWLFDYLPNFFFQQRTWFTDWNIPICSPFFNVSRFSLRLAIHESIATIICFILVTLRLLWIYI